MDSTVTMLNIAASWAMTECWKKGFGVLETVKSGN